MRASQIISQLRLEKHPFEGGYFRRTYGSEWLFRPYLEPDATRTSMSSIYYMLTSEARLCYLHKNRSDIMHYYHSGGVLRYWLLTTEGHLTQHLLGPDLEAGQQFQLLAPGGCWKAAELVAGDYVLLSEAVTPGFDFEDHQLATVAQFCAAFPLQFEKLRHLIKS